MKDILITGAGGGMGKAAADLFADRGYRVFAVDRVPCPARENVIPLLADVTEEKSVRAGAKRKNFTPFSSYHCRISLSMLKGGLSTTTAFFLYLNA